jgi:methylated-DNA-protein-cysteine methyltransferase-like protein
MKSANSPQCFFQQVYELVAQIPAGKVATYGQIAAILGNPRAARTVGWALHSLPRGSNLPWQRVVNARGEISTGKTEALPSLQQILLETEGIEFSAANRVDLERFQHIFKIS